jgi:hypothetical protein
LFRNQNGEVKIIPEKELSNGVQPNSSLLMRVQAKEHSK